MSKPHPRFKSELATIITTIRAGKDPDTGLLHLTENEAQEAILQAVAKHLPKEPRGFEKYSSHYQAGWMGYKLEMEEIINGIQ